MGDPGSRFGKRRPRNSFNHDADFVHGRIEERPGGELDHGRLQRKLLLLLSDSNSEPHFVCYPELRVQVAPERFLSPTKPVKLQTYST